MAAQVINITAARMKHERQHADSEAQKMLVRKLDLAICQLESIKEVFLRDEVRARLSSVDPNMYIPPSVDTAYKDMGIAFKSIVNFCVK